MDLEGHQSNADLLTILPAGATCLVLTGCRDKPSAESESPQAGSGSFNGRRYSNEFFGLTVTVPSGWYVPDATSFHQLMTAGAKLVGESADGGDDASGADDAALFSIFRYRPGQNESPNPGLIAVAEPLRPELTNTSSGDYLKQLVDYLKSGPLDWSGEGAVASETIGDISFNSMGGRLSNQTTFVDQTYYVTIRKDHAVCFILSYTDDQQRSELKDILSTIRFQ